MERKRILIVADKTAGGEHLRALARARTSEGPCEFTLLVPAIPPAGTLTWTEAEAAALAEWRLKEALSALRATGAEIHGRVGDARPLDAIADVIREQPVDEIVVSTLPRALSRWTSQKLPRKARRFGVQVTHVVDFSRGSADALARIEAFAASA
jgi:hypothetical protein